MPQIDVDPEELRRFANNLHAFNDGLREYQARLKGGLSQLSGSWKDNEFRRFEEEFNDIQKELERFLRTSDEQIPRLLRKATAAEDYLQQR